MGRFVSTWPILHEWADVIRRPLDHAYDHCAKTSTSKDLAAPRTTTLQLDPPFLPYTSIFFSHSIWFPSMSARYAPLPNPHTDPTAENEMEAAFDDSDDEEDNLAVNAPNRNGYHSLPNADPFTLDTGSPTSRSAQPGTYDFENVDYDYIRPPPGSPPGPSSRALPNEFGNSNGEVPSFQQVPTNAERNRRSWFSRAATSVLPSHYVQRLGLASQTPSGVVGGGTSNDGVFANVTAKPSRPLRVQEGAFHLTFRTPAHLIPKRVPHLSPVSSQAMRPTSFPKRLKRMPLRHMHLHKQILYRHTGKLRSMPLHLPIHLVT